MDPSNLYQSKLPWVSYHCRREKLLMSVQTQIETRQKETVIIGIKIKYVYSP